MAFVYETKIATFPKVYNVEQAVGPNAPNATGDVKLVQYMIRNIYGQQAAALKVDGWIGPTTNGWIKRFQTDAKAAGNDVLVDGRIDRAFGQISTISKTIYAILVMNTALKKTNPNAYQNLATAVPLSAAPKSNPYNGAPPDPDKVTYYVTGKFYVLVANVGTTISPIWRWAVYDGPTRKFIRFMDVLGGSWVK
jgi:hypothetical protein